MDTTKQLASYLTSARLADVPSEVRHEAHRALLNIVGCSLGGAREPAVDIAIRALGPYAGKPEARVLGRAERFDPLFASLLNGLSSHVHDYDDTTPSNYIHPSSPVASALFAYASVNPVKGADFLHAFILGVETVTRIGNATYPAHYEAGWHSTGSVGVFGAAVAIGRLLGLSPQNMTWAVGLAATQAAGLREMFGSMGKAFHPGRSAQSGYMAALLAREGFTSGEYPLEAPRGFAAVTAGKYDLSKVTGRLGSEFTFLGNTYKPFPCGIVTHPTIDACIQIARGRPIKARDIAAVRLRVAPLVIDLCNKKQISKGLEGKFSVFHAAAIGLVRGKAGLREFTDETVNDPDVKLVREQRVTATPDPTVAEDAVRVEVEFANGERIQKQVDHAIGNLGRPMSDAELEEKVRDQAALALPPGKVDRVIALCWKVGELDDVRGLVEAAVPGG